MPSRALAASSLVVFALGLAGCGGQTTAPTTQTEPTGTGNAVTAVAIPEAPTVAAVYFLRDGKVGLALRDIVAGQARVERATVDALLEGPTRKDKAAGLATKIPAGTRRDYFEAPGGAAHLLLSANLSRAATAQVVYTLTQIPGITSVSINNQPALRRSDLEALTPPILVESPAPFEEVSSPLRITGTANTYEATFNVEVLDGKGRVLGKKVVTATSGSGTRGTFDATVPFKPSQTSAGKVVFFETSAEDGSRTHEVEIPVGFD